jgi:hypothetical protein
MTLVGSSLLDQTLAAYVTAAVPFGTVQRDLLVTGQDGQWAALLHEIDQTILPRRLVFDGGGGASLTLDVADRHVLGVVAVSGLPHDPPGFSLVGQVLAEPTEAEVAQLRRLLIAFVTDHLSLGVRSTRGIAASGVDIRGVSVNRLRQIGVHTAVAEGLLERFMTRLAARPTAFLRTGAGGVAQSFGAIDHLQELAQNLTDAVGDSAADAADQMIILSTDDDTALLFARAEGAELLVGFDPAETLVVAAIWLACELCPDA